MTPSKMGNASRLSLDYFCSSCGGALITGSFVSPVHFNHDPQCGLGEQIAGIRLADRERLQVFGEGHRPLRDAERTLLADRGATVLPDAICVVRWSGLTYLGVRYGS